MSITGVILAGGTGSRLFPITRCISKQLLPIYDKPMIYYPMSVLMIADIRDVLIITTSMDQQNFIELLGDGSQLGMRIRYAVQNEPGGIAQAIHIAEPYAKGNRVCLVLGDNLFYGQGLNEKLTIAINNTDKATVFAHHVVNPEQFGVVELDASGQIVSLLEKPQQTRSNLAITGLYFYPEDVFDFARDLQPSQRGELEITDLNIQYLEVDRLQVNVLGRGFAWLDTGTFESLSDANDFVRAVQKRQGLKIASVEEIAYRKGWIDGDTLERLAAEFKGNEYGCYLADLHGKIQ